MVLQCKGGSKELAIIFTNSLLKSSILLECHHKEGVTCSANAPSNGPVHSLIVKALGKLILFSALSFMHFNVMLFPSAAAY